ncbi:MAG: hypothetical protein ACFFC7_35010 [Candidatus Hermodarchaeota archaeon]
MTTEALLILIIKFAQLGTGLVLCFLGKVLLEKGVRADFFGEGEIASKKLRIITSSPGIIFLIAGLSIVIFAIKTQAELTIQTPDQEVSIRTVTDDDNQKDSHQSAVKLTPQTRTLKSLANINANAAPNIENDTKKIEFVLVQMAGGHKELTSDEVVQTLNAIVDSQPKTLKLMLDTPAYEWILQDEALVEALIKRINDNMSKMILHPSN